MNKKIVFLEPDIFIHTRTVIGGYAVKKNSNNDLIHWKMKLFLKIKQTHKFYTVVEKYAPLKGMKNLFNFIGSCLCSVIWDRNEI